MRFRSSKKEIAQAAIELAVFGAILLFVLSVIVRQAFTANFGQNQTLRALRIAMSESYKTSSLGSPARNLATVIIIEDHLSPALHKYGSDARMPFAISASATHSNQLFQPMTWGVGGELPRVDFFINGQHFQFTTAGYKEIRELGCKFVGCGLSGVPYPDWDDHCASRMRWNSNPLNSGYNIFEEIGCRKFYRIVQNYFADVRQNKFCCQDGSGAPLSCSDLRCSATAGRCCDPTKNISVDQRFDLDLNPATSNSAGFVPGNPVTLRQNFSWQWYMVKGFAPYMSRPGGGAPIQDPETGQVIGHGSVPFTVTFGDVIVWEAVGTPSEKKDNTVLNFDGDLKEETILDAWFHASGVLDIVHLLDQQDGDLDFTGGTNDTGPRPGLGDDLKMYSFIRDTSSPDGGTYFLIEEGKLFQATGDQQQFYRNVQKRDKVDLVERIIQLSNNTGRFCDGMTRRPIVDANDPALAHDNPVEVCSDNCFQETGPNRTIDQTCYFVGHNVIYVRSRLKDLGGKKWVTPVTP